MRVFASAVLFATGCVSQLHAGPPTFTTKGHVEVRQRGVSLLLSRPMAEAMDDHLLAYGTPANVSCQAQTKAAFVTNEEQQRYYGPGMGFQKGRYTDCLDAFKEAHGL